MNIFVINVVTEPIRRPDNQSIVANGRIHNKYPILIYTQMNDDVRSLITEDIRKQIWDNYVSYLSENELSMTYLYVKQVVGGRLDSFTIPINEIKKTEHNNDEGNVNS